MHDSIAAFKHDLNSRPEGISPYTVRGYTADLRKFADWFHGATGETMEPANVTPVDVRDYKAYLQTVANCKPATINRAYPPCAPILPGLGNRG